MPKRFSNPSALQWMPFFPLEKNELKSTNARKNDRWSRVRGCCLNGYPKCLPGWAMLRTFGLTLVSVLKFFIASHGDFTGEWSVEVLMSGPVARRQIHGIVKYAIWIWEFSFNNPKRKPTIAESCVYLGFVSDAQYNSFTHFYILYIHLHNQSYKSLIGLLFKWSPGSMQYLFSNQNDNIRFQTPFITPILNNFWTLKKRDKLLESSLSKDSDTKFVWANTPKSRPSSHAHTHTHTRFGH